MSFTAYEYHLALYRLEYIDMVKNRLCECMELLTAMEPCTMALLPKDKAHAAGCLRETLDELFHHHAVAAREVKETVERERWLKAIEEWRVP